jgi:hypothetical protein
MRGHQKQSEAQCAQQLLLQGHQHTHYKHGPAGGLGQSIKQVSQRKADSTAQHSCPCKLCDTCPYATHGALFPGPPNKHSGQVNFNLSQLKHCLLRSNTACVCM